jgi:hypothetical protein
MREYGNALMGECGNVESIRECENYGRVLSNIEGLQSFLFLAKANSLH